MSSKNGSDPDGRISSMMTLSGRQKIYKKMEQSASHVLRQELYHALKNGIKFGIKDRVINGQFSKYQYVRQKAPLDHTITLSLKSIKKSQVISQQYKEDIQRTGGLGGSPPDRERSERRVVTGFRDVEKAQALIKLVQEVLGSTPPQKKNNTPQS